MGQKDHMYAEANAQNTSGPHDESPHGGGRRRPPHIMWSFNIFSICLRLHFLLWPHIVISALAPYCIAFSAFAWAPKSMFFQLPCRAHVKLGIPDGASSAGPCIRDSTL